MKSKEILDKLIYEKYYTSDEITEQIALEAMEEYAEQYLLHFLNSNFVDKLPAGSYTNKKIVKLFKKENNIK